ncbi:TRAP transporter large permease [Brevibacterium sp. VCM10]|uniref:TRAP transporter large permease n=1 Tax=Brevibacterium sp. VCM10 TaxID=1381751 RepID=UPI0004701D10|nr:TRAP transporter large permease [Brevibacterium sp. VCM10]
MSVAIVVTIVLIVLILLRVPVAFAIFGSAILGLLMLGGVSSVVSVFEVIPLSASSSIALTAVPLFIFMAYLVLESGALDALFSSARILVGRIRGGTGIAAVAAGAGFASVSGSSTASAATLAKTSTGAMIDEGYSPRLATGAVASAGTLAAVIPPSVLLIFYGITAETNIGKTMLAGLVPGVIMALALGFTVWLMAVRGHAPKGTPFSWSEKLKSIVGLLPVLFLFLIVVAAIFFGVTTATEAAAVGCLGGLVLMVLRGRMSVDALRRAVAGTVTNSAMILAIVVAAKTFGHVLAEARVTPALVDAIGSMTVAPIVVLLLIMAVYLVMGFFMDQMAIIALTVPITLPLVTELGYDPIWFGVMVILLAEIGLITPPLGINAFVASRVSGVKLETVFLGSIPFIVAMLVVVLLILFFPEIALFVPETASAQ